MSQPFKGVENIDIKDSAPDWEPYTQPIAPEAPRTCCTSSSTTSGSRRWSRTAG